MLDNLRSQTVGLHMFFQGSLDCASRDEFPGVGSEKEQQNCQRSESQTQSVAAISSQVYPQFEGEVLNVWRSWWRADRLTLGNSQVTQPSPTTKVLSLFRSFPPLDSWPSWGGSSTLSPTMTSGASCHKTCKVWAVWSNLPERPPKTMSESWSSGQLKDSKSSTAWTHFCKSVEYWDGIFWIGTPWMGGGWDEVEEGELVGFWSFGIFWLLTHLEPNQEALRKQTIVSRARKVRFTFDLKNSRVSSVTESRSPRMAWGSGRRVSSTKWVVLLIEGEE